MEHADEIKQPLLRPIKDGWGAYSDGWGVHGATREEALANFRKAEERYREIDARPVWYEKREGCFSPAAGESPAL